MTFFDFEIDEKDLASAKFIGDTRRGLIEALLDAKLEDSKISQSMIAEKIGMDRGSLSKMLNGSANMTLRKIAEISWALGLDPEVHFKRAQSPSKSNIRPASFCGFRPAQTHFKEINAEWQSEDFKPRAKRVTTSSGAVRFENAN